jgi:hypothetical protein
MKITAGGEKGAVVVGAETTLGAGVMSVRFDQTKFATIDDVVRTILTIARAVRERGVVAP